MRAILDVHAGNRFPTLGVNQGFSIGGKLRIYPLGYILPILGVNLKMMLYIFLQR